MHVVGSLTLQEWTKLAFVNIYNSKIEIQAHTNIYNMYGATKFYVQFIRSDHFATSIFGGVFGTLSKQNKLHIFVLPQYFIFAHT